MLVRVVDYVANPGGGVRFTTQLLSALASGSTAAFEIVSAGAGLDAYRRAMQGIARVAFREVPPVRAYASRTLLAGIPGAGPLNALLGTGRFYHVVPRSVLDGADVTWFPWIHRHRIHGGAYARAAGSLHDVIALDFPDTLSARHRAHEAETLRAWLASAATVVVSSHATTRRLQALFATPPERVHVVPLSGRHARPARGRRERVWPFEAGKYLISPINLTSHKNFEALLRGFARWGARYPLVVTGPGTDVWRARARMGRGGAIARLASSLRLRPDVDVFGLGYQDDATYDALLEGARALVMPSLAEGGGSFPVWEALEIGVPVVSSDIPAIREMVERIGADVLWFDPLSPDDLARGLSGLEDGYERLKANAVGQIQRLRRRTWLDVARDYASILRIPFRDPDPQRAPVRGASTESRSAV